MRWSKYSFFLMTFMMLSGCAPVDSTPNTSLKQSYHNKYSENLLSHVNADEKLNQKEAAATLARAATSVSHSLRKLAEIESAVHPSIKFNAGPIPAKIGMANLATIDWTGPAAPLLKRLAKSCHYQFRTIGKKPTVPILIAVNAKQQPIATIIRDVSYQIQRHASVKIFAHRKVVEMRYR